MSNAATHKAQLLIYFQKVIASAKSANDIKLKFLPGTKKCTKRNDVNTKPNKIKKQIDE
jgi:hypothetical protein